MHFGAFRRQYVSVICSRRCDKNVIKGEKFASSFYLASICLALLVDVPAHERPLGEYARPHESRRAGMRHPRAANRKRAPAIPPRNPRSTLARLPSTHPTPPPTQPASALQSNRSGIISSIALRAFKAILPFVVVL